MPNPSVDPVPFGHGTLRAEAAQQGIKGSRLDFPILLLFQRLRHQLADGIEDGPAMTGFGVMKISGRACLPKQQNMIAVSGKYARTSVKRQLTSVNHGFTLRR